MIAECCISKEARELAEKVEAKIDLTWEHETMGTKLSLALAVLITELLTTKNHVPQKAR